MAGEGAALIGNAYIAPDYDQQFIDRVDRYKQVNRAYEADKDKQKKEQQQRQDALYGYVNDSFKDKDFATGTAYDQMITQKMLDLKTKYAGLIKKSGTSLSGADLTMMMGKDLKDLTDFAGGVKLLNKTINDQSDKYKDMKSVDPVAVKQLAMNDAIYDPGTSNLRDPNDVLSDLQKNTNYAEKATEDHPDLVQVNPNAVRNNYNKSLGEEVSGKVATAVNQNGVVTKVISDVKMPPFFQLKTDKNGHYQLDNNNQLMPEVKGQINPDTGQMEVDDHVATIYMGDPEKRILINSLMKKQNADRVKQKLDPIDKDSPAGQMMQKELIYKELQQVQPPKFGVSDEVSNAALWANQNRIAAAELKANKKDEEKPENFVQYMSKVNNNDPDYLKGQTIKINTSGVFGKMKGAVLKAVTGNDQGQDFVNISAGAPNGIIYKPKSKQESTNTGKDIVDENAKAEKEPYEAVWYNPQTKDIYTQDSGGDVPKKVTDKVQWLRNVAIANGMKSTADVNKYIKAFTGASESKSSAPATKSGKFDNVH